MRRLVPICIWMLMLTLVTDSDRPGSAAALAGTALLKVGSRAAVLGFLAVVIAWTYSDLRCGPIIRQLLPWWCFGVWAIVSTFWSPLKMFSIGQSVSLVMLLMLSYCTAMVARQIGDASEILWHLCLGVLLLSAAFIVANIIAADTFSDARENVTGGFHPTNASATAGLGLVLIVSARLGFAWPWTRWLIWPSLLLHSVALLLAQNRTSIAITIFVVGGIALLHMSAGWRWLLLTSVSFASAIYVTLDPGFMLVSREGGAITQYIARDQSVQQLAALSGREEMWTAMWDSFLRSPWIGHGYFVSSESGFIKVWYVWSNWTAHDFWLQVLVGTGIIGGALLAWGLISYAARLVCARGKGIGLRRLANMGIAVLIWQTCWGVNNESFAGPVQAESIVFFIVLGLITGRMIHGTFVQQSSEHKFQSIACGNSLFPLPMFRPTR